MRGLLSEEKKRKIRKKGLSGIDRDGSVELQTSNKGGEIGETKTRLNENEESLGAIIKDIEDRRGFKT